MKIFKIFALAAMMLGMVACDNGDTPEEVVDMNAPTAYVGTVSVVVGGQTVPTPDSLIEIVPSQDGKSFSIVFKKIKFVPAMPALDITIPTVNFTVADGAINLVAEGIIPLCMGGEFPNYLVTALKGTITATSIDLSLKFGEFETSFKGTVQTNA